MAHPVLEITTCNDTPCASSSGADYDQESNFDYVQEVLDIPTPLPQFNEQGSRLAVKNRYTI